MLETIWFVLWGLLWAIYFILDGFDLGMGTLMPFVAKNDMERRVIYNAQGPFWDGNEVWLITAGGVTFAAFPKTYAVMFSGLYSALLLLLFALILRGVSYEFRGKVHSPGWRKLWDVCHVVGSFLPALLLGVAFANIFKGIPIDADGINQGNLFSLLNPYGLLGGVLFVLMFCYHGALWLAIKGHADMEDKAWNTAKGLWPFLLGVTLLFVAATAMATDIFTNYLETPPLMAFIFLPLVGLGLSRIYLKSRNYLASWISSAIFILGVTLFGVLGIFPALLPSSLDPAYSMTIYNSASSTLTLQIMLAVSLVTVPMVLLYQFWVYKTFIFRITEDDLAYDEAY